MPQIIVNGMLFDSYLESEYYDYLKQNNIKFIYQDEYRKNPIKINIAGRKTYKPDFIVWNEEEKTITIIELKGYSKWSGNIDDSIMNYMLDKVENDKDFIIEWLTTLDIDTRGYDIKYRRLKHLRSYGFVDYHFKNPNTLAKRRKEKINDLQTELKELQTYKKNVERYFSYLIKDKLTKQQKEWKDNFEKEYIYK